MAARLTAEWLAAKTRDMHLQYYSLILGVSQNVIMALFMSRLGLIYTEAPPLAIISTVQFTFNVILTLTLIVFVYYSYYSFMLFYSHMLRMRDILHPTFVTLAQAGLIYNLQNSWEFYAFSALFFAAASCAICSCWAYTDIQNLGETDRIQQILFKRFRGHFLACLLISVSGAVFSAVLCYVSYSINSDALVYVAAGCFFSILCIYRVQERRFVKSVYEISGISAGHYKFVAGIQSLLSNDAWIDLRAALLDALNSCIALLNRARDSLRRKRAAN